MAQILRVKLRWTGLPGGVGYSLFHFREFPGADATADDALGAVTKVAAYMDKIANVLPNVVGIQTEGDVEVIEETNNQLVTVFSPGQSSLQMGRAPANAGWAAVAGAVISWSTGGVRNGRRVRGRNFVVPLSNAAYDLDGSLTAAALVSLNEAATALRAATGAGDLGIYGRPSFKGANDGIWFAVTGHRVPDMAAILTSRRS